MTARKFKLLHLIGRIYYFCIIQDFDCLSCVVNQSVQLMRFVCGLDSHDRDHSTSHEIQTSTVDPWTQTRALITTPLLSLSGASGFPSIPPTRSASSSPRRAPSLPPHINYSLSPVASAPPSVTPGVTESGRSEVVLPIANQGISQKSLRLKPCGPAGQYPHDPRPARGDRDPPVLVNNGLFQSVSSSRLIAPLNNLFYMQFCIW